MRFVGGSARWFSLLLFLVSISGISDDVQKLRLRVAAANLTSGNKQSYDPGHGIRIMQSLKPDIIALQEFNFGDNSKESIQSLVEQIGGKDWHYYRESAPKYRIPNGIVSRYPIEKSGTWASPLMPDRGFAWAQIKLPTGDFVWVVSLHLSSKSSKNREIEADELVRLIKKNIPDDALLMLAGDLNTKGGDREEAIKVLKAVVQENHAPDDGTGDTTTNANRNKRYDWVLFSPRLDTYHVPAEVGGDRDQAPTVFPNGIVVDTRVTKGLPKPAVETDSGAAGMQHMMIVKDLVIPFSSVHKKDSDTHSK